jgi:chromosome segregation ATPase
MANSREMAEKAFSLLQDALQDSESRAAELDAELRKERTPKNILEKQNKVLEHRLASAESEREELRRESDRLQEILESERIKIQQLKKKLDVAESGPDKVGKKEVNFWRARAEQIDEDTKKYKQRIAELRQALKERPDPAETELAEAADLAKKQDSAIHALTRQSEEQKLRITQLTNQTAELKLKIQGLTQEAGEAKTRNDTFAKQASDYQAELETLTRGASELKATIAERNTQLADLRSQNSQLNSDLADKNSELTDMANQLNSHRTAVAEKDALLAERDQRIVELADAQRAAEEEKRSVRNQIAGLEEELKEEKECTVNLSEVANERREQITELSEKLDEAQERYEEAKWRLEGAQRFQRLVAKRRKLIDSLIAGHRAKQKSNTALKAGLDGLRKFKAKSEQQQQKLLIRIDELSNQLKETEQQLASGQLSKKTDEKLKKTEETVSALEERLNAQVEIIENLESELNAAKAARQTTENQHKELAELKTMLETRNATIAKLEAALDDQQKQLGKLRGSESETLRLKAVQEQDQSMIDDLQLRVDSLTAELLKQQKLAEGGAENAAQASGAEIRKRESQISDLKRSIKDQEREIAKLNEAVTGWQKKYEFLSTEPPSAYQSAAAEK